MLLLDLTQLKTAVFIPTELSKIWNVSQNNILVDNVLVTCLVQLILIFLNFPFESFLINNI